MSVADFGLIDIDPGDSGLLFLAYKLSESGMTTRLVELLNFRAEPDLPWVHLVPLDFAVIIVSENIFGHLVFIFIKKPDTHDGFEVNLGLTICSQYQADGD